MAMNGPELDLEHRTALIRRGEELSRQQPLDSTPRTGTDRSTDAQQSRDPRAVEGGARAPGQEILSAQDEARAQERRIDDLARMQASGTALSGAQKLTKPQLKAIQAELKLLRAPEAAAAREALLRSAVPSPESTYNRAKNRFDTAQTGYASSQELSSARAELRASHSALSAAKRELDVGRIKLRAKADTFRLAGANGKLKAAQEELAALQTEPQLDPAAQARSRQLQNGQDPRGIRALTAEVVKARTRASQSANESRSYSPTATDGVDRAPAAYRPGDPGSVGRAPEDVITAPDPSVTGAGRKHTLEDPDGLWGVAREEYGTEPAAYAVAYANRIDAPDAVAEGRELTLPPDAWVMSFMDRLQKGDIQVDRRGSLSGDLPDRPAELSREVRTTHFGTLAM